MLIPERSREICFALVVKNGKTRSGGLVDKPQSTATLWRALVAEFVFPPPWSPVGHYKDSISSWRRALNCSLCGKMNVKSPSGTGFSTTNGFISFLVGENARPITHGTFQYTRALDQWKKSLAQLQFATAWLRNLEVLPQQREVSLNA